MKNSKIERALNAQINAELWSAYLYLSMSADFAAKGMPGMSNWMLVQFKEEQDHALRLLNYIVARGGAPALLPIGEVPRTWSSPLEVFRDTLAHEKKVTGLINELYRLSVEEQDHATGLMLQWFVGEQVQEEQVAQELVDKLTMIGDNGFGLYTLDRELGARVYVPPVVPAAT